MLLGFLRFRSFGCATFARDDGEVEWIVPKLDTVAPLEILVV